MSARSDAEAEQVQSETGVTTDKIKTKLTEQLEATHVEIEDMSGLSKFNKA